MKQAIFLLLIIVSAPIFSQEFGTLTDPRDGKTYKTVQIGNQIWMAENLAYIPTDSFFNKEMLVRIFPYPGAVTAAAANGEFRNISVEPSSERGYCVTANVGGNAHLITDPLFQGSSYRLRLAMEVCPDGWHLPSSEEWDEMVEFLGGKRVAGEKLKSIEGWYGLTKHSKATNESGFSGKQNDSNGNAFFWSYYYKEGDIRPVAKVLMKRHRNIDSDKVFYGEFYFFPIRCIKD